MFALYGIICLLFFNPWSIYLWCVCVSMSRNSPILNNICVALFVSYASFFRCKIFIIFQLHEFPFAVDVKKKTNIRQTTTIIIIMPIIIVKQRLSKNEREKSTATTKYKNRDQADRLKHFTFLHFYTGFY